jgi:hypothetical protein
MRMTDGEEYGRKRSWYIFKVQLLSQHLSGGIEENISQNSRSQEGKSNPRLPEYEAEMPATHHPQYPISVHFAVEFNSRLRYSACIYSLNSQE